VESNSLIGLGRTIVFASQYKSNYTVITRNDQQFFLGNLGVTETDKKFFPSLWK